MSLQTMNSTEPHKKSKGKSSKKRKHEGAEAEISSNKKIKQEMKLEGVSETNEADMNKMQLKLETKEKKERSERRTGASDQRADPELHNTSETEKKRKRKKHKHKDKDDPPVLATPSPQQSQDTDLPEAPLQEEAQQPQLAQPEQKRTQRKEPKEREQSSQPVTNGHVSHKDVQLPDAPLHFEPQSTVPAQPSEPQKKQREKKKPKENEEEAQLTTNDTTPVEESLGFDLLDSADASCFYSTRVSLYLPVPAITLPEHGRKAILSMHVSPLLLTYFPPVKGIVVAYEDPVFSAEPAVDLNLSLQGPSRKNLRTEEDWRAMTEVLALSSDQFGAAYVWLTVTLLVFKPLKGDEMYGWNNIASEGFVGIVSYNYFQTAVGASRIPSGWTWKAPMKEQRRKKKGRTEKMLENGTRSQSSPMPSSSAGADEPTREEIEDQTGFWDEHGQKVAQTLKYRVVDTDMVPGGEKGKWSMHIDGTLLPVHEERETVLEEKEKWERMRGRQSGAPGLQMSGGLGLS